MTYEYLGITRRAADHVPAGADYYSRACRASARGAVGDCTRATGHAGAHQSAHADTWTDNAPRPMTAPDFADYRDAREWAETYPTGAPDALVECPLCSGEMPTTDVAEHARSHALAINSDLSALAAWAFPDTCAPAERVSEDDTCAGIVSAGRVSADALAPVTRETARHAHPFGDELLTGDRREATHGITWHVRALDVVSGATDADGADALDSWARANLDY